MNKEKLINDINKLIDEIVVMLEEEDLISLKVTLEQTYIIVKTQKELTEKLKTNIIDNINKE